MFSVEYINIPPITRYDLYLLWNIYGCESKLWQTTSKDSNLLINEEHEKFWKGNQSSMIYCFYSAATF